MCPLPPVLGPAVLSNAKQSKASACRACPQEQHPAKVFWCPPRRHQVCRRQLCCRAAHQHHARAASITALPVPEGSLGLPLIGETLTYIKTPQEFYQTRYKQHGSIFKSNIIGETTVFIYGEQHIRRLLQGEHKLVESTWPINILKLLGPGSLITQQGPKHTSQRRIMSQAFTKEAVHSYVPAINAVVERYARQWRATGRMAGWEESRRLAFDVAATTLLGFAFKPETTLELRRLYDTYVMGFFGLPNPLPTARFGKALKARRDIRRIIQGFVREQASQPAQLPAVQSGRSKEVSNVMRLCAESRDEQGKKASLEELTDQCLTQLFAGHETTGVALARMLTLLPKQPEVLRRLREEQAQLQSRHGPEITGRVLTEMIFANAAPWRHITCTALGKVLDEMVFADAVLREQLRMHPIVPAVWRRALQDIEVDGKRIPKGWRIQLMMGRAISDIPDFKDTVEDFSPDRWLDSNGKPIKDPLGYTPWGDGARVCIGMRLATTEIKAVLAVLLREFEWGQADPTERWGFFADMKPPAERFQLDMNSIGSAVGVSSSD